MIPAAGYLFCKILLCHGKVLLTDIRNIQQNILNPAVHNPAEVIQGRGADGLIVPEPVDGGAADTILIDQNVGAQTLLF